MTPQPLDPWPSHRVSLSKDAVEVRERTLNVSGLEANVPFLEQVVRLGRFHRG